MNKSVYLCKPTLSWSEIDQLRARRSRTRLVVPPQKPYLELSVPELGVPTKTVNALEDCGVTTVEELLAMQPGDLAVVPNLGDSGVSQLIKCLKKAGAKPPWTLRAVRKAAAAQALTSQIKKQPKTTKSSARKKH